MLVWWRASRRTCPTLTHKTSAGLAKSLFGVAAGKRCIVCSMQQVTVIERPENGSLIISLVQAGRERNLDRGLTEPLQKALARLEKNAQPAGKRSKKGKQNEQQARADGVSVRAQLLRPHASGSAVVPDTTLNRDAWKDGFRLIVGSEMYAVVHNPPTVDKIEVPGKHMHGYPLYPLVELAWAEEQLSKFQWLRLPSEQLRGQSDSAHGIQHAHGDWQLIAGANERSYTCQAADVGCQLRVDCTPAAARQGHDSSEPDPSIRHGATVSCTMGAVLAAPPQAAASERHPLTRQYCSAPSFRIVTYNILADQYAATDYAQQVLFSFCPAEYAALCPSMELLGYHADVLCLQEVDERAFDRYFSPHLRLHGYRGLYLNKAGSSREGSATFFRSARYRLHSYHTMPMSQLFREIANGGPAAERHAQLRPQLKAPGCLRNDFRRVSTTCQISMLLPLDPSDTALCVVNTHLFFHPKASHMRTLMTAAIVVEALHAIDAVVNEHSQAVRPALIFCGDFNSGLNHGMPGNLELLRSGFLSGSHYDWQDGAVFNYSNFKAEDLEATPHEDQDQPAEADDDAHAPPPSANGWHGHAAPGGVTPAFWARDISLPCTLQSADGLSDQPTTHVRGYTGALDYVWYDPRQLQVVRQIPLPGLEELQDWMPSQRFPSDHLAVVFDMQPCRDASQSDVSPSAESRHPASHSSVLADGAEADALHQALPNNQSSVETLILPAEDGSISAVTACLRRHEVVALPTDTLYGLAACASSSSGIDRIYQIKGRPASLPLAICVADAEQVGQYADCRHLPTGLLQALLPGPVTLLLPRLPGAPLAPELNPGVPSIGIRVPDSGFIRHVCRQHGGALALTSANTSGSMSSTCIADFQHLWPACAAVVDAGSVSGNRQGSTIVQLAEAGCFQILRPGSHQQQTHRILTADFGLKQDRSILN